MSQVQNHSGKKVIAIVGPTASGKSAVADSLAAHLGSAVISADSMQVYRYMDIGTAKMSQSECQAPLLMVDVCTPATPYSAALYQTNARSEINRLLEEEKTPIICGGTGLYIRAALDAMEFPSGEAEDDRRKRLQAYAEEHGSEALYEYLEKVDPKSASVIHPHNIRRVIRALEMADEGKSYADQKAQFSTVQPFYDADYFGLTMNRARLYERINKRVDQMFEQGLVQEVTWLIEHGYKDALTAMQAIGYKEIIDALDGSMSLSEARELIKTRSRRYAKRQLSWFRRDERVHWIDMDCHSTESAVELIRQTID